MFVGVSWSEREESREAAAARIADFMAFLGTYGGDFATWYGLGRSRAAALRNRLDLDARSIAKKLKVSRTDYSRELLPDLGFMYSAWNGNNASFGVTIGCWCKGMSNVVHLEVRDDDGGPSAEWYRPILEEMIRVFDPDEGVISSDELQKRAGVSGPWDAGWFTYERGSGIQQHSWT